MNDASGPHVIIAGGGLSGLALAQGLRKQGISCHVYERDADLNRKQGYYLHMNPFGGEALRALLPEDLFELYLDVSRTTYERKGSMVLDNQLDELSFQPHKGPPNDGPRNHTGVHRRTLRQVLLTRMDDAFTAGVGVTGYTEDADGVTVRLTDGTTTRGDVLVGADGLRSVVRGQRLPEVPVIDTGVRGIGVYGRTPLTEELNAVVPPLLHNGVIMVVDDKGSRLLLGTYDPRRPTGEAVADRAPDAVLDDVEPYIMVSCSVEVGFHVPPNDEWTADTAREIRDSQLRALEGWHPAARAIVEGQDLESMFMIPFGYVEVAQTWEPSRVTLIGDAAHAMLPTLGMGANLAIHDSGDLSAQLGRVARGEAALLEAIGAYEAAMRGLVYPFHAMTLEHDKNFGGGALQNVGTGGDHSGRPDGSRTN